MQSEVLAHGQGRCNDTASSSRSKTWVPSIRLRPRSSLDGEGARDLQGPPKLSSTAACFQRANKLLGLEKGGGSIHDKHRSATSFQVLEQPTNRQRHNRRRDAQSTGGSVMHVAATPTPYASVCTWVQAGAGGCRRVQAGAGGCRAECISRAPSCKLCRR